MPDDTDISGPVSHDQNFKNLILDYPLQALQLFAPQEAVHLDTSTRFTPIREEQLKDRLSDRFLELDIPLLLEWPDGRREALLFVIEQQTEPRQFSIHKLARYCLEIAELMDTRRVVPVVIFLKANRQEAHLVLGNELHDYLHFRYIRAVLPDMQGARYLESDNLVARLNLPNMHWPPELKLAIYASAVRGLLTLEQNPDRQLKYLDFIDIYARLTNNERADFERQYTTEERGMSGFIERYTEQGRQQGLLQGLEQGLGEGRISTLRKQLTLKFGALSATLEQRLEQAAEDELELWTERILFANRIEDVFSPGKTD
ncbi:hypothetical protein HW090_08840 [Pseudomonas sp. ABC1]|uniref:hypothetical protein n=1 Tax=Pseudomonas sp. ABC1 TaxID=2748080 RepID=UPI0015C38626|nr:hypothetical protein [Pseudomonas sp. ABC1]QLF93292.1 hypothetical protein HW090_08840 [Pseudomonas sp. ABC1]